MPKELLADEAPWYRVSSALAFLDAEVIEFERDGRRVRIEFSVAYPVVRIGQIIVPYDGETLPSLKLLNLIIDNHDALRDHLATRH